MCDTLVTLTEQGVLFAKNSDRDPNEAQYLDWVPAAIFAPGTTLRCTWIDVPQATSTLATLLSRPWWIWGAEMGANERGVVIGNEAVFTKASLKRSRHDEPALLGMDLLRLALERADSAERAVSVIVDLLERYGQGGPASQAHPGLDYDNSFIVADTTTAFVLETAGREWATEQVRPGGYRSISNGLTIEPFAKAHSDPLRTKIAEARKRCALTTAAARGASRPAHLARALRSHGESSPIRYSVLNGAMAAPCMHAGGVLTSSQTVSSWISDLHDGIQHWATGTSAPCLSIFKPVTVERPVDLGPSPDNSFDAGTLWWCHERLHRLALRDVDASLGRFATERDRMEAEWFDSPPESSTAFELARKAENRWTDDLARADLRDTRPFWLRQLWRRADSQAGMRYG